MKNKLIAVIASLILGFGTASHVNAQSSEAAGGMSVGTAVAIGVVGAALLVALGDSSSSAPAAVAAPAATTPAATTTTVTVQSTSTTNTTATTTN